MRVPPALTPLRHAAFRALWTANVVTALGTWMQNTGAGWLMTTLAPDALSVSLVQAATIVPTVLLALPAGALADIVDRRVFMIGTQAFTLLVATLLALLTWLGAIDATGLIALTFLVGVGSAMYQPAWGATVPELVPREDLVGAIALNGIGFNLARAIGPALGGVIVLLGGASMTFALFAVSFVASIGILVVWRRRPTRDPLPREHLLGAMRNGLRFVRNAPAMRAAIVRAVAYFLPSAATWALLPLVVRDQLGLGAGSFGMLLGMMGVGGVASGMLLPAMRGRARRGTLVFASSLCSGVGMLLLGLSTHWALAGLGMMLFGIGWVAASSTAQAAAQLVAPPWVRARALAIYQLAFNGALAAGSLLWGALGGIIGLSASLLLAAGLMGGLAVLVRGFELDEAVPLVRRTAPPQPVAEAVAPELAPILEQARGRILEAVRYRVPPDRREAFLAAMAAVRRVRGRAGGENWRLYEDVAHPEQWAEMWHVSNWTDHLREQQRLSDEDRDTLNGVAAFRDADVPRRYLSVTPPPEHHFGAGAGNGA